RLDIEADRGDAELTAQHAGQRHASAPAVTERLRCCHWGPPIGVNFPEDKMNETPQQYTQRILGYMERRESLIVQAATARNLERLIKVVSTAKLRKRPAADKWSVSEIIAHLADAEIVIAFRMRMILGSPGAPVAAYDQDSWATAGHYDKRDARKSI